MADLLMPGGGLTKSKLELATAAPGDVVAPETFYASDKELKTGTLTEMPAINRAVGIGSDGDDVLFTMENGAYRTNNSAYNRPEIRATKAEVIQYGLGLMERGQYQNAGGIGSGGSGSSAYVALNRIPEGIYRANGADWAPEIRVNKAELSLYILNALTETFYISTTASDEIWYGGRGARRSSSAKAVWFAHFTSGGYIGWTCASFNSSGANLSSIASYSDSIKKSASGSLGHTVYYSYMKNRLKERDTMRVTINGTTKYIRFTKSSVMMTDSETLSSEIINMLEQLLV